MIKPLPVIALLFAILMSSCGNQKLPADGQDTVFEEFRSRYVEQMWKMNPSAAIYAGYHKYDSVLIAPDEAYRTSMNQVCEQYLDTLKTFNEKKLTDLNRIDLWMIRDNLNSTLWYNKEFKSYEWNPASFNVAGEFAEILNGRYAPLDKRLRTINDRLEQVPAFYAAAKKQILNPTIEHTDLAIYQHEGSVEEVFGKALADSVLGSGLSLAERNHLIAWTDSAKKAIASYVDFLKEKRKALKPENARSFRIGKVLYDKKFEYDIVSRYSAEEIYQKALKRKDEIHNEMAKITATLWPKYFGSQPKPAALQVMIRKMIDTLSVQHVSRDSFLQSIEKQIPQLIDFINKKELIYIDPSKPLVVRKTPAYMEGGGAGASISAPGPYDKEGNTYYNVSLLDGYTPEMAESYLREYNRYILQILNIHEAIPGHYTQLVYSNQSPSIIKSILGNGAMVEGWAVYSERMMLENGYGNNEPEMWLMYYKWHLRTVCNTILDYSVHEKNMSEEEAMKLLMDGDFQQTAEAQGKWKRVKLTQVQLDSYFTGFTEIYDLREEMKKLQGDKFNLKAFHEKFLSYGSAPVKYIRELMLEDDQNSRK